MKRLSMFVLALAMALGLYSLGAPKDAAAAASAADQRLQKLEARVAALEQANAALRGMVRVDKRVLSLEADRINISQSTYESIREHFECEYRGRIPVKNAGKIDMYFVTRPKPAKG